MTVTFCSRVGAPCSSSTVLKVENFESELFNSDSGAFQS